MKTRAFVLALVITLPIAGPSRAQEEDTERNVRVAPEVFRGLAATCAPEISFVTLRAIARAESAFHPYALSLNYPSRVAREHGLNDGGITLARQPRTKAEGLAWTHYLLKRGRSVSVGLMQINTQLARELGVTVDQLFDPCTNMKAGARLLAAKYREAARTLGEGQTALHRALSEYNSGSAVVGLNNGYVTSVIDGEFRPRQLP